MFGMDEILEGGDQGAAPMDETPVEVYDDEDDYEDEESQPVVS